jgi:hypothetical protein
VLERVERDRHGAPLRGGLATARACVQTYGMNTKTLAAVASSFVAAFVPAVAAACPSAASGAHGCGGGSSYAGYVAAVGIGLLVGIGSVAVERKIKR